MVNNVVTGIPCTAEGHGSHCTDIRVLVIEQLNESIHHSWVLELGCVWVWVCGCVGGFVSGCVGEFVSGCVGGFVRVSL